MARQPIPAGRARRYRIGFLQTVMLSSKHRYRLLRAEVEGDPSVDPRWYPLRSWVDDDWLRFLPAWWRVRIRHLLDSFRLFVPSRLDAVVVHAPEMWGVYGLYHRLFRRRCVLVENSDSTMRPTGKVGRRLLGWADRRGDLFVPWSGHVAADILGRGVDPVRVQVLNPGLPVEDWPMRPARSRGGSERFGLLFVGGEPVRKGLDVLLDAFEESLADSCELHIATQARNLPAEVSARIERLNHVHLHLDLQPASAELKELFVSADLFVLPTRYDISPWVLVESLATGLPVVATDVGGIADMVVDGETGFLIRPDDRAALVEAITTVRDLAPDRREALVEAGRSHVERHFDIHSNTRQLLDMVKLAVDHKQRRQQPVATTGSLP